MNRGKNTVPKIVVVPLYVFEAQPVSMTFPKWSKYDMIYMMILQNESEYECFIIFKTGHTYFVFRRSLFGKNSDCSLFGKN